MIHRINRKNREKQIILYFFDIRFCRMQKFYSIRMFHVIFFFVFEQSFSNVIGNLCTARCTYAVVFAMKFNFLISNCCSFYAETVLSCLSLLHMVFYYQNTDVKWFLIGNRSEALIFLHIFALDVWRSKTMNL